MVLLGRALAGQEIAVAGINLPLVDDSINISAQTGNPGNARVETFASANPVEVVVNFYEAFLRENNFAVLGGWEDDGYSVSAKKEGVMFTLRIYPDKGRTIIQFIW